MAPRRSSRALTTQPTTATTTSQQTEHSSSSSTASGRAERHTRSHTKTTSPQKAVTPRSRNSEEQQQQGTISAPARAERLGARRTTRQRASKDDEMEAEPAAAPADDETIPNDDPEVEPAGDDDDDGEEEVTRCVCGHLDYPGLPLLLVTELGLGAKPDADPSAATNAVVEEGSEPGSLFVQCDRCKVWQHGGCVGILAIGPNDDYFCELCRPDLHRMHDETKEQRFTRYLPHAVDDAPPSPTKSIIAKPTETTRSTRAKNGGAATTPQTGKRRSTMNSRDAAYDEEEQLRRAIEQSKAEKAASRKGRAQQREAKRARSDSHEQNQPAKRQRTDSHSAGSGSPSNVRHATSAVESGDEHPSEQATNSTTTTTQTSKTLKGAAAARHQREKELREEAAEREKERAEAAGRRKGRADRRRAEGASMISVQTKWRASLTISFIDSEAPDETVAGSRPGTAMSPPASTPRPMDAPPPPSRGGRSTTAQPPTTTSTVGTPSTRKTTRVAPSKRGKGGRSQYTRERELARESSTMTRSQSRDGPGRDDAHGHTKPNNGGGGQNGETVKGGGRSKQTNAQRTTSITDMKRRASAMLDFISRVQVEMASEKTPTTGSGGGGDAANVPNAHHNKNNSGAGEPLPKITLTTDVDASKGDHAEDGATTGTTSKVPEKDFADLGTVEMMDVLTRKLVLWQQSFGELTDK
ncbi:MAG: hypothetical protein M1823_005274 [Watsoniomyces obsoletus]|nr:MAG: hypothetical protein M1823_005274 [Watsoniomyces obsoletus]